MYFKTLYFSKLINMVQRIKKCIPFINGKITHNSFSNSEKTINKNTNYEKNNYQNSKLTG